MNGGLKPMDGLFEVDLSTGMVTQVAPDVNPENLGDWMRVQAWLGFPIFRSAWYRGAHPVATKQRTQRKWGRRELEIAEERGGFGWGTDMDVADEARWFLPSTWVEAWGGTQSPETTGLR